MKTIENMRVCFDPEIPESTSTVVELTLVTVNYSDGTFVQKEIEWETIYTLDETGHVVDMDGVGEGKGCREVSEWLKELKADPGLIKAWDEYGTLSASGTDVYWKADNGVWCMN